MTLILESTDDLQEYCLRKLGKPVINIEISTDQLCDRLDDALQFYAQYHYNGTEEVFFKHNITAGDVSRGYLRIKDEIVAILDIVESYNMSTDLFDNVRFLLLQDSLLDFTYPNVTDYYIAKEHIETVSHVLTPVRSFTFNYPTHRLIPHAKLVEDKFVILRGYRIVDPEDCSDIYNERSLKKLAVQYVKQQWGSNLKKFSGVQTAGGIELNGQQIYDEATEEIEKIEEEFQDRFEAPIGMFVG